MRAWRFTNPQVRVATPTLDRGVIVSTAVVIGRLLRADDAGVDEEGDEDHRHEDEAERRRGRIVEQVRNFAWMTFPIIVCFVVPRRAALMKSPRPG